MKFWDSSAILPLVVKEKTTSTALTAYRNDSEVVVWWATEIECFSALARLSRESMLEENDLTIAIERLTALAQSWYVVQPTDRLRQVACRMLRVHPLRAADAQQLAAAMLASEMQPSTMPMYCLDHRLAIAARKEGFSVGAMGP